MMTEFDLIKNIKSRYGLTAVGDDCAVLPNSGETDLLMTADLLVESVDFELDWTTPAFVGHKALAVSLSDIAAMGGTPKWAMLSLGIPTRIWNSSFIDEFYHGWHALAAIFGVELIGGDISRSPDKLVIDSVACGEAPRGKAILRSGAVAGDAIFVTGELGGAAGGLKLLLDGVRYTAGMPDPQSKMLLSQLQPKPNVNIANLLQQWGFTTAMIDLSDGLSSDLHHLIEASGVGANIDLDSLPVCGTLREFFDNETCRMMALNGGEDFELLFTCAPVNADEVREFGCKRIGSITAVPNIVITTDNNRIKPGGFRHF